MEKFITFKSFTKQNGELTNFIRSRITGYAYRLLWLYIYLECWLNYERMSVSMKESRWAVGFITMDYKGEVHEEN